MPLNMDSTEDIQKYIAMAQSLTLEAKNVKEFNENNDDSALHNMGALLASNCEKLCIGPSFHFYTAENAQSLTEPKQVEVSEPSITEMSDDDEYETVIYKGPGMPLEIMEEIPENSIQEASSVQPMMLNMAQASAEYGGLLSPEFFLQNMDTSSGSSYRTSDGASTDSSRCPNTPFSFPNVHPSPEAKQENTVVPTDDTVQQLERVELLDDHCESDESKWVEWPKKFIEKGGFSLGVQPGNFYKEEDRPNFYVKLPHRSKYEVLVTNNNQVPCNLDLDVDGKRTNSLRIPAGTTRSIDGPQTSKFAFNLFRVEDAPAGKKVKEGDTKNGLIKAEFVPCKIEKARLRTASEPLRADKVSEGILDMFKDDPEEVERERAVTLPCGDDHDNAERSARLDTSRVTEGATFLQGERKKRKYRKAPEMETDPSRKVVLQLRLIASLDEEVAVTGEEIHDLEPPPLLKKKR